MIKIIAIDGAAASGKTEIAKRHLLPKQLKLHGIEEKQFTISDEINLSQLKKKKILKNNIAKIKDSNQMGTTVLLKDPKPNCLRVPSLL